MGTAVSQTVGSVAALGASAVASYVDVTTPYIGVPLNVLIAALLGVSFGMAWNKDPMTRRDQVIVIFGSAIAACAAVAAFSLVASYMYHVEVKANELAPFALLIALFGPSWIPAVKERIGPWLDKIPFIGKGG